LFVLTSGVVYALFGTLSQVFGRNPVYQTSLWIFILCSIGAGFAQSMEVLLAFRGLQGVGAGGILAMTQIISGDAVSSRERGVYQAWLGSGRLAGVIGGPIIGGLLIQAFGFRACFFVNAPVTLAASLVSIRALGAMRKLKLRVPSLWSLDLAGAALVLSAATALMFALTWAGKTFAWDSWQIIALFVGSLVVFALFVANECYRAELPVLDLTLFAKYPAYRVGAVGFSAYGAVLNTLPVFVVGYFQYAALESPLGAGLRTLPLLAGTVLSSMGTGRFTAWTGSNRGIPTAGMCVFLRRCAGLCCGTDN
jgi:MFS family permease